MTYQIHRGGQARTVKGVEAKRKMQQLAHTALIEAQGPRTIQEVGNAVAWWTDLRRGRQTIYGALLRYIDVCVRLGTPRDQLKKIPRWIDSYIDDQYEPANTGELRIVAMMRRSRFAGSALLLLSACHSPTEPEPVIDPSCTLSAMPFGIRVRFCYRICPEGAEQFAAEHGQVFTRGYTCDKAA